MSFDTHFLCRYIALYGRDQSLLMRRIRESMEYKLLSSLEKAALLDLVEESLLNYKDSHS
jgi:hypothetical protein